MTIGVDVGGTNVRAGVVDDQGGVLETTWTGTPQKGRDLEHAVAGVVEDLTKRHDIAAVGLAVAAFVHPDRRSVRFAPHLPWRDVPVADRIAALSALPVTLEHDANAAAVAEYRFGAAQGHRVMALVALGTGIGAALLVDGEIFHGTYGVAPELGHLPVVAGGRSCPCGKSGCWERYCSGTALATTARELLREWSERSTVLAQQAGSDHEAMTGRCVASAAGQGDPVAQLAMAELAKWLGQGLALVSDVYDPEVVVIAGAVSDSAPLFLEQAKEHYAHAVTGAGSRPLARIRTAMFREDAAIVGAATLAREQGWV